MDIALAFCTVSGTVSKPEDYPDRYRRIRAAYEKLLF
jgi:hypothetical protein